MPELDRKMLREIFYKVTAFTPHYPSTPAQDVQKTGEKRVIPHRSTQKCRHRSAILCRCVMNRFSREHSSLFPSFSLGAVTRLSPFPTVISCAGGWPTIVDTFNGVSRSIRQWMADNEQYASASQQSVSRRTFIDRSRGQTRGGAGCSDQASSAPLFRSLLLLNGC